MGKLAGKKLLVLGERAAYRASLFLELIKPSTSLSNCF